jgi:hypothetical protein
MHHRRLSVKHQWDFYRCLVNDASASIFLDLTLQADAPQPERPHLLSVWVYMLNPRLDGLSNSNEETQLFEIEDRLAAVLADRAGALYVGRITTSGRREYYYYATAATGFEAAVSEGMSVFPAYRHDCDEQDDAQWLQYLELLYPPPREMQRIRDRWVVETLEENEDLLHVPREVDHYLYFPSEQSRQVFVAQANGAGFAVKDTIPPDAATERPNRFGLRIVRSHPVDLKTVDSLVTELIDRAVAVGGEYDGWETPVIREDPRENGWKGWPWRRTQKGA